MDQRASAALALLLAGPLGTGCASLRGDAVVQRALSSACVQAAGAPEVPEALAPFDTSALPALLRERFSERSLLVAHALGITGPLERFAQQAQDPLARASVEARLARLEAAAALQRRLSAASLAIAATAAEMDCEEERADQVAVYVGDIEARAETRLTVAAIAIGAAGGIVSGVLLTEGRDDNAVDAIGVATGIAEIGLGTAILLNRRKVRFAHPRNALRDVWEGRPASGAIPPMVWAYLDHSEAEAPSLRERLLDSWTNLGQLEAPRSNRTPQAAQPAIYFGDGGLYTSEQLSNRANMLDQLESYINLMQRDLLRLAEEIEALR